MGNIRFILRKLNKPALSSVQLGLKTSMFLEEEKATR